MTKEFQLNEDLPCYFCNVCGDNALFQCGNCNKINYCSEKCQLIDWTIGLHSIFCPDLNCIEDDDEYVGYMVSDVDASDATKLQPTEIRILMDMAKSKWYGKHPRLWASWVNLMRAMNPESRTKQGRNRTFYIVNFVKNDPFYAKIKKTGLIGIRDTGIYLAWNPTDHPSRTTPMDVILSVFSKPDSMDTITRAYQISDMPSTSNFKPPILRKK
jgi:hypothetical protein